MAPNSQRYDYTYRRTNLCVKPEKVEDDENTIYDVIKSDPRFSKTLKMINTALMKMWLKSRGDGYTMFIAEDKSIPDSWMKDLDTLRAQTFLNSYIIMGEADKAYLLQNGSSIYMPRKYHYNNPIIAEVHDGEVIINKVGRVVDEISASNGQLLILDNIAEVTYM